MKKSKLGSWILVFVIILLLYSIMQGNSEELPIQEETPYVESATSSQFYYEQLSENQKKVYDILKKESCELHSNIRLNRVPSKDVTLASYALHMDYPALFWLGEYTYKTVGNDSVTEVIYSIPETAKDDLAEVEKVVEQIQQEMDSRVIYNDYEKLKFFYDWIIEHTEYESNSYSQDMRSVFLHNSSVCAGYSRAFQYLCQKNDMECTYIPGYTNHQESHAWNLVKLSGKYYWVDVTWGDPLFAGEQDNETNYNFFLVDDEDFLQTHVIEMKEKMNFSFPQCTDNSLNYYRLNHCYFEKYDTKIISNYLREKFRNNSYHEIELKFHSKEEFDKFMYQHIQKNGAYIYDDIRAVNPLFYGTMRVSSSILEDANYVKVNVDL